jgi:hypothetical protein
VGGPLRVRGARRNRSRGRRAARRARRAAAANRSELEASRR